jgi:hypothetical protein
MRWAISIGFREGREPRHGIIEEIGGDGEQPIPLVVRIILNTISGVLAVVAGVAVTLLFSRMGFLVAVFGWMVSKPDIMWTALAMSLGAFTIRWCYDLGCLVPLYAGAEYCQLQREGLWDKYYMAAPQRQRRCVERYNIVKRA